MMASTLPTTPHAVKRIKANDMQNFEPVLKVVGKTLMSGKLKLELSDGSETVFAMIMSPDVSADDFCVDLQVRLSGQYPVTRLGDKAVMMLQKDNITILGMGSPDSIMSMDTASVSFSEPAKLKMQTSSSSSFVPTAYVGTGNSYITPYKTAAAAPQVSPLTSGNNIPINMLNPYSNKWTIRARVTAKSEVKSWTNAKGSGSFFSVDLLDNDETAIKALFWRDACEKFKDMIQLNGVYYFSQGRVKLTSNSQMSIVKNKYELDFSVTSNITPCADDSSIKAQKFNIIKISDLPNTEINNVVDILCIVKSASEVSEITLKTQGKTTTKRELTVLDDSNTEVRVTLWGEKAKQHVEWSACPIVLFQGLKVGEYGGRSLSAMQNTQMQLNPDMDEARALHEYRCGFSNGIPTAESNVSNQGLAMGREKNDNWKFEKQQPISSIKDDNIGIGSEKGVWVNVTGYVERIFHEKDPWYNACPDCQKKLVSDMNESSWSCEKCQKTFDQPSRRYIMTIRLHDYSGQNFFSIYNDEAQKLLGGNSADHLNELKRSSDNGAVEVERIYNAPLCNKQYSCLVLVKEEMVKEERKPKAQIKRIDEVDFIAQNKSILTAINKFY